jgi:hypothetical protein
VSEAQAAEAVFPCPFCGAECIAILWESKRYGGEGEMETIHATPACPRYSEILTHHGDASHLFLDAITSAMLATTAPRGRA